MVPNLLRAFFTGFLYLFAFPSTALAYLDPGSGSMMLQLLLGGVAGLGVLLKIYWQSVVSIFRHKKLQEDSDAASTFKLDK
jgi:hypothetical protein